MHVLSDCLSAIEVCKGFGATKLGKRFVSLSQFEALFS